jgi:hypothetical protein
MNAHDHNTNGLASIDDGRSGQKMHEKNTFQAQIRPLEVGEFQ